MELTSELVGENVKVHQHTFTGKVLSYTLLYSVIGLLTCVASPAGSTLTSKIYTTIALLIFF